MKYHSHIACVIRVDDSCQHSDVVFRVNPDLGAIHP